VTVSKLRPPVPPAANVRLQLGAIAGELQISLAQMADATGISKTAISSIVTDNDWPVRTPAEEIRDSLRKLFVDRGASDEQLANLFQPHVARRSLAQKRGQAVPPAPRPDFQPSHGDDTPQPLEEVIDMLPSRQTLSYPARKAFGILANPFEGEVTSDPQMFSSGEVNFARESCLQAAIGGRFVALVGESGAGKTTVVADMEERIERDKRQVVVIKPWVLGMEGNDSKGKTLKASDILASIVSTLNPTETVKQTLQGRSNQVEKLLIDSAQQGNKHLLVIEEAHCLPDATLKHLKRLHEMRLGRHPLLGILLVAQPELKDSFKHRASYLREVVQRCEVVDLMPLDNELGDYLATRAKAQGHELAKFIDQSGIEAIRARLVATRRDSLGKARTVSLCYPLAVNNLLTAAMNQAAELGAPVVTRDVVRAV
jgi:type II secretory pathway predicted ATPase ExeA